MRDSMEYFRGRMKMTEEGDTWYKSMSINIADFDSLKEIINFAEKCYNKLVSKDEIKG